MEKEYNELIKIIKENYWTISVSESMTGGFLSSYFTKNPGASDYFVSGIVVYSNFAKKQILNVNELTIKNYGAVSMQVAQEMVEKHFNLMDSNIYISVTGNAGPNPIEDKAIGLSYIGMKIVTDYESFLHIFEYNAKATTREEIIDETIDYVIKELLSVLKSLKK